MPFKAYGYVAKFFFVPVPRLTFPVQPAWPFKEPFSDRKTRKTLTTRRGLYIWTRKYLFFRIADATYRGPWVKFAKRYKFVLPLNMQTSLYLNITQIWRSMISWRRLVSHIRIRIILGESNREWGLNEDTTLSIVGITWRAVCCEYVSYVILFQCKGIHIESWLLASACSESLTLRTRNCLGIVTWSIFIILMLRKDGRNHYIVKSFIAWILQKPHLPWSYSLTHSACNFLCVCSVTFRCWSRLT